MEEQRKGNKKVGFDEFKLTVTEKKT